MKADQKMVAEAEPEKVELIYAVEAVEEVSSKPEVAVSCVCRRHLVDYYSVEYM